MPEFEIWPAIDLRGGKCVRLQQGDYGRETVFGEDPVAMARHWVEQGARRLHIVDLDGARQGAPVQLELIGAMVRAAGVPCQVGGGVRSEEAVAALLAAGVVRVVVGTRALREPEWLRAVCARYPQRLVLSLDARGGRLAVDGWTKESGRSVLDVAAEYAGEPLAAVAFTDIARDGMLAGPDVQGVSALCALLPMPVLASGGVASTADIAALAGTAAAGCIIGRALYEGRLTIAQASEAARRPAASYQEHRL